MVSSLNFLEIFCKVKVFVRFGVLGFLDYGWEWIYWRLGVDVRVREIVDIGGRKVEIYIVSFFVWLREGRRVLFEGGYEVKKELFFLG